MKKIEYLNHNGVDYQSYPDDSWFMAPFPSQKLPIYCNDNLATVNREYHKEDSKFNSAHEEAKKAWPNVKRDISWRLHVFLWAFGVCLSRGKEKKYFVELGTGGGFMSRALASYYANADFEAYLCDTFLPNLPNGKDENMIDKNKRFAYSNSVDDAFILLDALNSYGNKFNLIKGLLPNTLMNKSLRIDRIDFLHVDLNSAKAELDCLIELDSYIDEKTIILFDDTGAPGSIEQYRVHKEYSDKMERPLLFLPTGQSLII